MAVLWESTDQFGNMFIGVSSAQSMDELREDIRSLVEELSQRGNEGQVTVDFGYGEINGPNPEAVSHVLQVAWLEECDQDQIYKEIGELFNSLDCAFKLNRC